MTAIQKANPVAYEHAGRLLTDGGLVVLPTETVYGLAAKASDAKAISHIYAVKSRPKTKPLSVVVFSRAQAEKLGETSLLARKLMDRFWPGPLTLVLPLKNNAQIHPSALAGQQTIGIRYPDIEWVEAFRASGFHDPLVLPSANRSGHTPPTTAQAAKRELTDKVDLIIDSGACKTGTESTILAVDNDQARLLRVGAIPPEDLAPFSIEWTVT